MIPKIIHCCWFGTIPKGKLENKCLSSWKKILPDYEIKEWGYEDVKNLKNRYFQQALQNKKWAFASDYVRLYALQKFGGIYMDTDVEVFKSLDTFLNLDFFIGSEKCGSTKQLGMEVIGAVPNNSLVTQMLRFYDDLEFINPDGSFDMLPNTKRFTHIYQSEMGIKTVYTTKNPIQIAPKSYIFPVDYFSMLSKNSYAVHHFAGAWVDDYRIKTKITLKMGCKIIKLLKCRQQKKNGLLTLPKNQTQLFRFGFSSKVIWVICVEETK